MRHVAEQGDVDAQFNLGWCYYMGEGVPQDKAEAAKWYRKAAEQGDVAAIVALEALEGDECHGYELAFAFS